MTSRAAGEIVVLAGKRTPFGAFQGALGSTPAWALGAAAIRVAVAASGVPPEEISGVLMGCVLQAGLGQAPARQAALAAGLPPSASTATVNKVCGSGMEAVIQASRALAAGDGRFAAAGGMESMSQAPYLLPRAREGYRLGHQQAVDSVIGDALWDPYNQISMGECGERCAARYKFSRADQDAYAVESFRRANDAQADGRFAAEIAAVDTAGAQEPWRSPLREERDPALPRRATSIAGLVAHDEVPGKVKYDRIPSLKPSFRPDGTITAANASCLSDGAAALVLATAEAAAERGLVPVARLISFGRHAQDPLWFTTAPVQAARNALAAAGWKAEDVDLWEVNEAFAVVPMAFAAEMGAPRDRLNVRGGAISLGHPVGASGARILISLIAGLAERGAKRGLATVCIGGGEALAVCVQRP